MIPWKRKWLPTPVFLPGEFHGQRSLVGYSPWGITKSQTRLSNQCFAFKSWWAGELPSERPEPRTRLKAMEVKQLVPQGLCISFYIRDMKTFWGPLPGNHVKWSNAQGSGAKDYIQHREWYLIGCWKKQKLQVCAGVLNLGNTHSLESSDTKEYWCHWECDD